MMIECPACATRYTVSETAIPDGGRTVRCAKCGESWFQPRPEPETEAPDAQPAPDDTAETDAAPAQMPEAPAPRDRAGRRRQWAWAAIILVALVGASSLAVSR